MISCGTCGTTDQPPGARFCFSCGAGLAAPNCTSCGTELVPGARFCSGCGADQQAEVAPVEVARPVSTRRVTSVLFADLVGFTSLSESRDTEDVRELLSRYFDEARQVVGRYGGTVEKFIGDAVMAVWGVPTGHEDDAERAVRAGLELVTKIADLSADVGAPDLALRVGIVTGEVAVTVGATNQGMVAGDPVNTASRVQSAAGPGQVWVDETTRLLTTSAVTYVDVGSHQLKGKADPVPLWSARAVVAGVGGGLRADGLEAPLVGRDREMRLVKDLFHGVEESGRPSLLVIGGEAGVGKSRLGWELWKYIDGLTRPVRWHSGRCLAYGEGVAFFALADAVRARLQMTWDDPDADAATLLEKGLDRWTPDPDERAWLEPRLGALLGIGSPGNFQREDLFTAWTMFLHRVSEDEHPVVLLIDDAHHADDGLVVFVEHLLAAADFGCLVVLLTRPGLLEEHPSLASNRRASVLHVDPLAEDDMGSMLDGLVPGLPSQVRESLVERAEGIPLYAVETVRSLIDRDLVVPRGGQYVLADQEGLDLGAIGPPASLQTLIAARLDTLTQDQRRVVDQGSVIGNSFTRESIARLCPELGNLDEALAGLVRLQVLRREGSQFSAERGQYQFVQSAVRQVAYGTLSRRDRKAAHLAVVAELESTDDASAEMAPIIAQHYVEAIDVLPDDPDVAQLTTAAVTQLRRAAARSSALGSPTEAIGHLNAALARTLDEPERLDLTLELARQCEDAGHYADALLHAEAARAAYVDRGDQVPAAQASAVMGFAMIGLGDVTGAEVAVLPDFEALKDDEALAEVVLTLGRVILSSRRARGLDSPGVIDLLITMAERVGARALAADLYLSLAVQYQAHSAPYLSSVITRAAADLARQEHDAKTLARALTNLNADANPRDAREAVEFGREALTVAVSTGKRVTVSFAAMNLMIALWLAGEWDEMLRLVEDDLVEEVDRAVPELLRAQVLQARAEPVSDTFAPNPSAVAPGVSWVDMAASWWDQRNDRAGATGPALRSLRDLYDDGGLSDDFTVLWGMAAEITLAAGDDAGLAEVRGYVDPAPEPSLGNGLLGHRALLAARASAPDDPGIEESFQAALRGYATWQSPIHLARARAFYGRWLSQVGRDEDAARELAAARAVFTDLGATAWLAEFAEVMAPAEATAGAVRISQR